MNRDRFYHLQLFADVARLGGFRAAAREMGLSPSAVSHGVAQLEEGLGVRLLNRSTRSLSLTLAGSKLLARLEPAIAEIDEGLREACEEEGAPSGQVRITTPQAAAHMLLEPHLEAFLQTYPAITLDIRVNDRFVDIITERCDVGLRLGEALRQDMVAVRLGARQRLVIVAAPAYIARHGRPTTLEALAEHRCIQHRFGNGNIYAWEVEREGEELVLSDMAPAIVSNDVNMVLRAALNGSGIALFYEQRIASHLATGRLIELFPDNCPSFPGFFLYHASRKRMRPAVRAFIDFFVTANRVG